MGTPDFAVQSMAAIHASDHELTAVVTVPDKAAGRGKKQKESPVKKYAKEHHLPLLQPERLKEETFLHNQSNHSFPLKHMEIVGMRDH